MTPQANAQQISLQAAQYESFQHEKTQRLLCLWCHRLVLRNVGEDSDERQHKPDADQSERKFGKQ